MFNSYYEAAGPRAQRDRRGWVSRPSLAEVHAYRSEVDRRKVYIRIANSPKMMRLHPIYDTLGQATAALSEKYSVRELETIQDYMLGCGKILRDLTEITSPSTFSMAPRTRSTCCV